MTEAEPPNRPSAAHCVHLSSMVFPFLFAVPAQARGQRGQTREDTYVAQSHHHAAGALRRGTLKNESDSARLCIPFAPEAIASTIPRELPSGVTGHPINVMLQLHQKEERCPDTNFSRQPCSGLGKTGKPFRPKQVSRQELPMTFPSI